jgi:hypothetical protein
MGILNAAGLLLLAGAFVAPPVHAESPLTEPRIMAMFQQLESSVRARDARGVAGHFSPDAVIRLVMPPSAGGQKVEMGVQQYPGCSSRPGRWPRASPTRWRTS